MSREQRVFEKLSLSGTETFGIDIEKRASAYLESHPEASSDQIANAIRNDILEAGVEKLEEERRRVKEREEKRKEQQEEMRRELEERVKEQTRRIDAISKATAGTSQIASAEAASGDDETPDEKAIEKEKEVFTR